jgi:hypothetical protein
LLPLASKVFRSGFLPKQLGISVLVGAAGYLFDSGAHLLNSGVAPISRFTCLGELLLPLWLLIKGVNVERWQQANAA